MPNTHASMRAGHVRRRANPSPTPRASPAGAAGPAGKAGPPLFLSMPHYCDADPELAAGVVGLACDPERHRVFLDVGEHGRAGLAMHA